MFAPNTDTSSLELTIRNARKALISELNEAGYWEGHLSSSALSTATSVVALHLIDYRAHANLVEQGSLWLLANQNEDGGWGDTKDSFSNLSTTVLCWSALKLVRAEGSESSGRAEEWIRKEIGSLEPDVLVREITSRYGRDRTFAVPILMLCAICGTLGETREAWKRVLPLPFELAAFPRSWFAFLRLPVVSYALPALIAIGYARNFHAPPFLIGWVRKWVWPEVSRLLEQIQPSGGGFLEAAPLTGFVLMALASADQKKHPVVKRGVAFLQRGIREDGSWPIDTNLATWGTTLAVKGLTRHGGRSDFPAAARRKVRHFLMGQQYQEVHPYTDAKPGGWAWTPLSGGVPDADDTPGALVALWQLVEGEPDEKQVEAAEKACVWLMDLQNRDGGIPTFCKGWGALPFDRSSPDLTAHTLKAWDLWKDRVSDLVRARMDRQMEKAIAYLERSQTEEGYWIPLWFGNQHAEGEINPTYGAAMVLSSLNQVDAWACGTEFMRVGAAEWLVENQNEDGGWGAGLGTPSSIEETALAVEALAGLEPVGGFDDCIYRGADFLVEATKEGTEFPAAPIGFYFARLWYSEKLYPMVWTVSALESL